MEPPFKLMAQTECPLNALYLGHTLGGHFLGGHYTRITLLTLFSPHGCLMLLDDFILHPLTWGNRFNLQTLSVDDNESGKINWLCSAIFLRCGRYLLYKFWAHGWCRVTLLTDWFGIYVSHGSSFTEMKTKSKFTHKDGFMTWICHLSLSNGRGVWIGIYRVAVSHPPN